MKVCFLTKFFVFGMMLLLFWAVLGVVAPSYAASSSTEIGSVSDFNALTNAGCTGVDEISLTNDLVFEDFTAGIGAIRAKYTGVFDGCGHSVTIDSTFTDGTVGLFNYVDNATIKNLNIKFNVTLDISKLISFGSLIGNATNTTIENCVIYLNITVKNPENKTAYIGGIFGRDMGGNIVKNCAVYTNLSGDKTGFGVCAGSSKEGDEASLENVVLYDNEGGSAVVGNSKNDITADNAGELVSLLGEDWSACSKCGKILLNSDKIHACGSAGTGEDEPETPQPTEVTPQLAKTEYPYSQSAPELIFENFLTDANDDAYFIYEFNETAVGDYTVSVALAGNDANKYKLNSTTVNFSIIPLDISLEISSASSVYGDALAQIPYTISGNAGLDVGVKFVLKNHQNYGAGSYEITPEIADKNFNLREFNTAIYTILPREITLKSNTFSKIYDGTAFAPVLEFENVINADANLLSYRFLNVLPQDCGTYSLGFVLTGEVAANYEVNTTAVTAVITPRELDVLWDDEPLEFSNSPQSPTAQALVDLPTLLEPTVKVNGSGVEVGFYIATCATPDNNYILKNTEFRFEIIPFKAHIKWSDKTFEFDNTEHCPTVIVEMNFDCKLNYKILGAATNAGKYTATIVIDSKNIVPQNPTFDFEITRLVCLAEWFDTELIYNGFVQGPRCVVEIPLLDYRPPFVLEGGACAAGDNYCISVTSSDTNILIANASTNFVIKPYEIEIEYKNTELIFNGAPQQPKISFVAPDFASDLEVMLSGAGVDVGEYSLTASCVDRNFKIVNASCEFEILPRDVAVVWGETSFSFDNTEHFPEFRLDADIDYTIQVYATEPKVVVGKYAASIFTDDENIRLVNSTASYEILPAEVTLEWSNLTHIFDASSFVPSVIFNIDFDYEILISVAGAQTNAGEYLSTASTTDRNIALLNSSASFKILPREIEIEWGKLEFLYNGYIIQPEITFKTEFNVDITVSASGLDVGNYPATAICNNPNFTLKNNAVSYTISPRVCSVDFSDTTLAYTGEVVAPLARIVLEDDMNPKCAPEVYIEEGATQIGWHTATARTNSANFVLVNNTCEYEIVPSEVEFANELCGICVLGAVSKNADLELENVSELVGQATGASGAIFRAIKITMQADSEETLENTFNYTLDIDNLPEEFSVCLYDEDAGEFAELNYTYSENKISFEMGARGVVCVLVEKSENGAILSGCVIAIGVCVVLFAVVFGAILVARKNKR